MQKFLPNARNFCLGIFTRSSLTCFCIINFAYFSYLSKNQSFYITRPPKCSFRKIQKVQNYEAVNYACVLQYNWKMKYFFRSFWVFKKITTDDVAFISHPSDVFMNFFSWNRVLVTLSLLRNSNLAKGLILVIKKKNFQRPFTSGTPYIDTFQLFNSF